MGKKKEGESSSIDLKDIDPLMVDKLVHYLYNSNYDDTCLQIGGKQDNEDDEENRRGEKDGGRREAPVEEIMVIDVPVAGIEEPPATEPPATDPPAAETTVEEAGEQTAEAASQNEGPQRLSINASMYIIGDRYDLRELKDLAREKFSIALVDRWDKEDLPDVIRTIYENTLPTDRALRDCLVPTLQKHQRALRNDEDFMEVVKTHGDFAVDLIDAWRNPSQQQTLKLNSNQLYDYGSSVRSSVGYDGGVACPDCGQDLNYSFE
ncbi:MAG: hypothetical protein Q9225_000884 [Loekoesia sp. 1 TL-2023]